MYKDLLKLDMYLQLGEFGEETSLVDHFESQEYSDELAWHQFGC